jgi:hypothetical protein
VFRVPFAAAFRRPAAVFVLPAGPIASAARFLVPFLQDVALSPLFFPPFKLIYVPDFGLQPRRPRRCYVNKELVTIRGAND